MFKAFLKNYKILNKKLLVSVSGGVDSMVLCDLLLKSNCDFSVAHVNYCLRGDESKNDELFINNYCKINNIEFYCLLDDLSNHTKSIQSTAREVRYKYLKKLKSKFNYDYILTAHHLDDNIETVFLNLLRGKKNKTFIGIRPANKFIIRPILNFTKAEIKNYALHNGLIWRDDSSNSTNKYNRNKIRNLILPIIEQMNFKYRENFRKLFKISNLENNIKSKYFHFELSKLFKYDKNKNITTKKNIWEIYNVDSFELEYFQKFGFYNKMELLKIFKSSTGKSIDSKSHTILSNRDHVIIKKNKDNINEEYFLKNGLNKHPFNIKLIPLNNTTCLKRNEICIKYDIEKPLKLRRWKKGDFFFPTGMNGKKKLSKFFKDQKMSIFDKHKQWILSNSKDEVLWIVGLRADKRNLVKNGKCLKISI